MKQSVFRLIFTLLASVALLSTGCSQSDVPGNDEHLAPGKMVSVTLPLGVDESAVAATFSRGSFAESTADGFTVRFGPAPAPAAAAAATRTIAQELTNVWVLQFNSSGANVSTTNVGTLAAGAHLTIPSLQVGTGYTICVVANGVASGLSKTNPATLAAFESTMFHTTAVTDATKLPMSGKLTDVSVIDLGDGKGKLKGLDEAPLTLMVHRIHAELTLTVDFGVTGYTLTGAQLYNVPIGATYGWNSATTTFPVNTVAANFGYTDTTKVGLASLTPTTSGTKTTYKWFVGDNRRGEVAGLTAQTDRNKAKAPAYATFARVAIDGVGTIMYDVYLGSSAVTNFDVKRNMTYTLTTAIKGTADFQKSLIGTDARVSGKGFRVVNPPSASDYVTLDLLRWTKGNLVAKNTNECKVGAPADYGVYFQFGSLVGWTGSASGDGTGQGQPATMDKAVWPAAMGPSKPSYAWQSKEAENIGTLAHYYFNYSVAPWNANNKLSDIGTFAVTITDQGSATGTLRSGRYANLGVGDPCTYYLGAPWRLPNTTELASITDKIGGGWNAWSGITGRWVTSAQSFDGVSGPGGWFGSPLSAGSGTPKVSVNPFFPASGFRTNFNGSFASVTMMGVCWSSSVYSAGYGYYLQFSQSSGVMPQNYYTRSYGIPARCVASVP